MRIAPDGPRQAVAFAELDEVFPAASLERPGPEAAAEQGQAVGVGAGSHVPGDDEAVMRYGLAEHVALADEQRVSVCIEAETAAGTVNDLDGEPVTVHVVGHDFMHAIAGEDGAGHLPHDFQPVGDVVGRGFLQPGGAELSGSLAACVVFLAGHDAPLVTAERTAHTADFAHDVGVGHDAGVDGFRFTEMAEDWVRVRHGVEDADDAGGVGFGGGQGLASPGLDALDDAAQEIHVGVPFL